MFRCLLSALLVSAALVGCGPAKSGEATPGTSPSQVTTPMRIALAPSEDAEEMAAGFEPLRVHLEKALGREVKVIPVTDYASVIEAMKSKKIDIGWFGPLAYVLAKREAGAEVFAVGEDLVKGITYHSIMVVPAESTFQSIKDLKGKRAAFVDAGSASGYLVPSAAILKETQETADKFFSQSVMAGGHDAALLALKSRSVDVACIQDVTLESMTKKGIIDPKTVRVIWTSDPIAGSPLAFGQSVSAEDRAAVIKALTGEGAKGVAMDIPGLGNYAKLVPITEEAYRPIEELVDLLKIGRDQLDR